MRAGRRTTAESEGRRSKGDFEFFSLLQPSATLAPRREPVSGNCNHLNSSLRFPLIHWQMFPAEQIPLKCTDNAASKPVFANQLSGRTAAKEGAGRAGRIELAALFQELFK
ncbi:Hypothetical predicted protein [Podarcis lilfordi]|uniref:Uncharacterized protein n=1 Tax=Podarcis lilfordi TaxID=74358 RepID=A0AA35PA78_9SAUR|nr:Hypothetical predicted protein [Podarcis lilfordi]